MTPGVSDAPRRIGSPQEASAFLADGSDFILLGENHTEWSDNHQAMLDLMPALEQSHVRVLGWEIGPSSTPDLARLQQGIRDGSLDHDGVVDGLRNMRTVDGEHVFSEEGLHRTSDELISATNHNIRVVGVDFRHNVPGYLDRVDDLLQSTAASRNYTALVQHLYVYDRASAGLAADALTEARATDPGARMAIQYGNSHLNLDGTPDIDRPAILAEALESHGRVASMTLRSPKAILEASERSIPQGDFGERPDANQFDRPAYEQTLDRECRPAGDQTGIDSVQPAITPRPSFCP